MGVSLPGRESGWSDGGLSTERAARCRCGRGLLQEGDQGSGPTSADHVLDGSGASHRAVREMKADGVLPEDTTLRSSKYFNNLIEQDHRTSSQRVAVMLGFKQFRNAAATVAGIELMHRIRKG